MKYTSMVIGRPEDLLFGRAPFPVTSRRGIVVGGGAVYPELNFTLPTMHIESSTLPEIREHYRSIVTEALERAISLLPQMPQVPPRVAPEVLDGLPVTPRRPVVRLNAFPRTPEIAFRTDFIVQGIPFAHRSLLGRRVSSGPDTTAIPMG